jgi:hypothetical protein
MTDKIHVPIPEGDRNLETKVLRRVYPQIRVECDYDGFFESLVREWLAEQKKRGLVTRSKMVVISSGPYRTNAVTCKRYPDDVLSIDFYSALRTGVRVTIAS